MKQWDVILYPFPGIGSHPAVVISNNRVCSETRSMFVNVLVCTTLRSGATPGAHEIRLNGADGLDWATVVRCDMMQSVMKNAFGRFIGSVSIPRRRAISAKIIDCFELRAC